MTTTTPMIPMTHLTLNLAKFIIIIIIIINNIIIKIYSLFYIIYIYIYYNITTMKSKKSSSRFMGSSCDILHNKYILYLSFFFAILTAARYLLNNNLEAIAIFIIIGFLATYFSKNMIVILLTTTVLTNVIVMLKNRNYSMIEGMESGTGTGNGNGNGAAAPPVDPPATDSTDAPVTDSTATLPVSPAPPSKKKIDKTASSSVSATNEASFPNSAVPTKVPNKKESMSQLNPAPISSEGNSMLDLQKGLASGYNNQKEQAHNSLASMGGGGGGNNPDFLNQQSEMINNLKSIQPILDTAEKFIDKFEKSSISKMFANIGSMPGMSLLTGGGAGNQSNPAPASS